MILHVLVLEVWLIMKKISSGAAVRGFGGVVATNLPHLLVNKV